MVLTIILITLGTLVLVFLIGGFAAVRRRDREGAADFHSHLRDAERKLQEAAASDRGWDREAMEQIVRDAVAEWRPEWRYDDLHLVLVDDRPGVTDDVAHFIASDGDTEVRVQLSRTGEGRWVAERGR
jgi:hypothetical protein